MADSSTSTSASTSTSTSTIETYVEQGRQAFVSQTYKTAIEAFTRGINACPCNENARRPRCTCKDFAAAYASSRPPPSSAPSLIPTYEEASRTCDPSCPARDHARCSSAVHVRALDLRAAAFEALAEFDRARRDAEALLEMAPARLEGYMRLGKLLRVKDEKEAAWKVWCDGVEVGKMQGLSTDARFKKLLDMRRVLHIKFAKRDILTLPAELADSIFSCLTTTQLSGCLRVCKTWNRFLNSKSRAWRHLTLLCFNQRRRLRPLPRLLALTALARRAADVAVTLQIRHELGAPPERYQPLLNASRCLRGLDVRFFCASCPAGIHAAEEGVKPFALADDTPAWAFSSVTSLTLQNVDVRLVLGLCRRAAPVLEYLRTDVAITAADWASFPVMASLKHLVLNPCRLAEDDRLVMHSKTPNVVHLTMLGRRAVRTPGDLTPVTWNKLESLFFEASAYAIVSAWDPLLDAPWIPRTLRALHLMGARLGGDSYANMPPSPRLASPPFVAPPQLEYFSTLSGLSIDELRALIGPSVAAGTLRELVLPSVGDRVTAEAVAQLLNGATCVRSLRLVGLDLFSRNGTNWDRVEALLASLPNLEAVGIVSPNMRASTPDMMQACAFVERIIRGGKIRAVTGDFITGVMWNRLVEIATEFGVKLVKGTGKESPLQVQHRLDMVDKSAYFLFP